MNSFTEFYLGRARFGNIYPEHNQIYSLCFLLRSDVISSQQPVAFSFHSASPPFCVFYLVSPYPFLIPTDRLSSSTCHWSRETGVISVWGISTEAPPVSLLPVQTFDPLWSRILFAPPSVYLLTERMKALRLVSYLLSNFLFRIQANRKRENVFSCGSRMCFGEMLLL